MYSVEKVAMKHYIKKIKAWLNKKPKIKEWSWFIFLWCIGAASFYIASFCIKWLVKSLG